MFSCGDAAHRPFTTAYGSDDAIHSVLVRFAGGGHEGWGEACPLQFPTYSPEWGRGYSRRCAMSWRRAWSAAPWRRAASCWS